MEWRNRRDQPSTDEEMNRLLAAHRLPGMALRTRYDRTIHHLEQVFQPEELYFGFYEDLFSEAGFGAIQQFLGIDIPPPDFHTSVNASPKQENTTPRDDVARTIANTYRNVYTTVQDRFGERATRLWPGYQFLK
jgi:hypothetical protein